MGVSKQNAKCAAQLTYNTASGTGSYIAFSGTLANKAGIIIFDNQSNVAVSISDDGTNTFKTFSAGEALVLDMRANKGMPSEDFNFAIGTQFYANSAAGTGNFTISYIFAR